MSASTVKIVDAAMRLRALSPEVWEQFVYAIREYAAMQATEMVRCPPELLLKAQGMALTANDIAATLQQAPQLYEKMKNNG